MKSYFIGLAGELKSFWHDPLALAQVAFFFALFGIFITMLLVPEITRLNAQRIQEERDSRLDI